MLYTINEKKYNLSFELKNGRFFISKGNFGNISILNSVLIHAELKNTLDNKNLIIDENTIWDNVFVEQYCGYIEIYMVNPYGIEDITFVLKGKYNHKGIIWETSVINDNSQYSVMRVSYPTPVMSAPKFDFFVPITSGRAIPDAGKRGYKEKSLYPYHQCCMQYFAVYDEAEGIYIGIEDPTACVKEFDIESENNKARIDACFFGINGTLPANSFSLAGVCKWECFEGDWYDATLIYSEFVHSKTNWLPGMDKNGRVDTPDKFKNVPFWVSDYIPNSETQGLNKPMLLSAGSDKYEKGYWVDAVIELQKQLGVPIAYHVYNWHEIPFNIEYPHFLPAKKEFIEGAKKLKEHDIYVLPYINAVSWETRDAEMGHEVNFDNTGIHGAVINENGEIFADDYPQKTVSGYTSKLAPMCPTFEKWHTIIEKLSREMESTLDIDGIYFDEISAHPSRPCYNKEHRHSLGGGSYWVDGYKLMMDKIKAKKPKESFYFSECNAEPYVNSFDGLLTWMWIHADQVPAFSVIYAGYTQLIGRSTLGLKKEDYEFFKYSAAQSLLYGQQIGWCKADVIYSVERMNFLKQIVKVRNDYNALFANGKALRPPKVTCPLEEKVTTPGLSFKDDIHMPQVLSGTWQNRSTGDIVVFVVNISEENTKYTLSFNYKEYGINPKDLPNCFGIDGDFAICESLIEPISNIVFKFKGNKNNG